MDALDPTSNAPVPASEPRSPWLREALLIGLLALTLNLAGNGRISLWDRDEPRYAGCTREMRQSGDLIHPTFNAEPRYHKPVLIYWLMLVGTAIGGDNPFGARLVSVVAGVATCLLVWSLGRRMFGATVGRWAAIALATAPLMVIESKLATTDATLLFFVTCSMFAVWELSKGASRLWTLTFWVSLALAVLTKGPAAPALIGVSAIACWWWRGPLEGWKRLIGPIWPDLSGRKVLPRMRTALARGRFVGPVDAIGVLVSTFGVVSVRWVRANWGPLLFASLVLPWFIAIGLRSRGEYFEVGMGYHVMKRLTTGLETHGGFPGYYVVLGLVLLFPWSALVPAGIVAAWKRRKENPAIGFMLGWMVGPLLFLECVQTKIIHYYLPAVPAVALLAGWTIVAISQSETNLRRWALGRLSVGLLAGLGLALGVGLLAAGIAFPGVLRWPCLLASVPILASTLYAVERIQAGAIERAATGLGAAWAVVLLVLGGWLAPSANPYRLTPMVAQRLAELEQTDRAESALASYKAPGVVYEIGHPVNEIDNLAELSGLVRQGRPIAMALTDLEAELLEARKEFLLEDRGAIEGFDVERFRMTTLRMVLVHPESATASAPGQGVQATRIE
ncbi:hypothetical protein BH23PLA1_BH23PLA1_21200 [soil metagenome]